MEPYFQDQSVYPGPRPFPVAPPSFPSEAVSVAHARSVPGPPPPPHLLILMKTLGSATCGSEERKAKFARYV